MEIVVPELPPLLLCIPGGRISVKVSVPNRPAVHATLPAEKLIENLAVIESKLQIERRNRYMGRQHKAVYASIVGTVTDTVMTDETSIAVAVAAVWCALNHPKERNEMRRALGSYLKGTTRGFVAFEAFADGRVSIGVDQAPISGVTMERAKDEADTMNREGSAVPVKAAP
jgi:hypothetical protein